MSVALLVLLLAGGALWQPHDPDEIALQSRHADPQPAHPLGTDHLGRDLLSRLMVGGGHTLLVVAIVGASNLILGTAVGLAAAAQGGWPRQALLRSADFVIVMPQLVVALALTAVLGLTPLTAGIALGLTGWGPYAVLVYGLARRIHAMPYMQAAEALAVPALPRALRHVLPNTVPALLTYFASDAGRVVVNYAALAFLGLGADTSRPDWGAMLFEYRAFIFEYPGLMIWPGLFTVATALVLHLAVEPSRNPLPVRR